MAAISYHQLLLHHLIRPTPPRPSTFLSLLLLKPSLSLIRQPPLQNFVSLFSLHSPTPFICNSLSSSSPSIALSLTSNVEVEFEDEDVDDGDSDYGDEIDEEEEEEEIAAEVKGKVNEKVKPVSAKLPSLTVKEKKELASYGLGEKLKSQLVGKSGVTASVAASFVENLESNELLKIKIHRTCPVELPDVVKQLEDTTASVVVSQIGRTVILYRPSLTKLKAEEKKMQNRSVYQEIIHFKTHIAVAEEWTNSTKDIWEEWTNGTEDIWTWSSGRQQGLNSDPIFAKFHLELCLEPSNLLLHY